MTIRSDDKERPRTVPRPAADKELSAIGLRLQEAWEHAGTSQTALEGLLVERGLTTRGYLSKIQYGERRGTPELFEAIADVCGVDFHWLLTGRGKALPAKTPPGEPFRRINTPTPAPPSAVRSRP